uniref:Uncharacterized protein n=1 Tax=Strigamia maritima TaxID=126957 RepID=T1JHL1_STRMM
MMSETPTSALARHITAYVLLAGILGGLLLVLLVLCFCKLCFKPSKQLTRQPVLFTKYPSERQVTGGRGSRKYKSLDPSVTMDLETSCGYSENSASPRDQEDEKSLDPHLIERRLQPSSGDFPWFHGEAQV